MIREIHCSTGQHRLAACLLVLVTMSAPDARAEEARADLARLPVPGLAAQKEATKNVDDAFKEQVAQAKLPDDKTVLAKKIIAAAMEPKTDAAEKYVLYRKAVDLAVQAGDVGTAMAASRGSASTFDLDGLRSATTTLSLLVKSIKPSEQEVLASAAGSVVKDAMAADRYDLARQAGDIAVAAAKKSDEPSLVRESSDRVKDINEIEAAHRKVTAAEATLKRNPSDAEANLTLGRFYCLMKGDWDRGLPMLALGTDPTLKAIAQADLAQPSTPDQQVQAADEWWGWAEKQSGRSQIQARARAVKWYRLAAPQLNALPKAKADNRLATFEKSKPADPAPSSAVVVKVAANKEWQRGMRVKKGEMLSLKAEGTWCNAVSDRVKATTDADGMSGHQISAYVPDSNYGALVGQIGTQRFLIGRAAHIKVQADGDLEMRINDDGVFDNDGELSVRIHRYAQ